MSDIKKEELAYRIKEIRISRKETLEEFAEQIKKKTDFKIKTTKSNVSKWEKGLNIPNDITLKAISELGGVSIFYLLYGEKDYSLYSDDSIDTLDINKFRNIYELLSYFIRKNKINSNDIPYIFQEREVLLNNILLHRLFNSYTDRDIKLLSNKLSENVLEQITIHYKICELLGISSDIEKFNEDEKYFFYSRLRQTYYILEKYYFQSKD